MMKLLLSITIAALLCAGCRTTPSSPRQNTPRPIPRGATVYVIEAPADIFDDCSVDLINPIPTASDVRVEWIGEQALEMVLRYIDSQPCAKVIRVSQVKLRNGLESHVLLEDAACLDLSAKPILSADGRYATLEYAIDRLQIVSSEVPGTDLQSGPPRLKEELISEGTVVVPLKRSLMFSDMKEYPANRYVIVHVGSVDP